MKWDKNREGERDEIRWRRGGEREKVGVERRSIKERRQARRGEGEMKYSGGKK